MQLDQNTITHGGIEWGAEISAENGGKPLPWLKEDEHVYCEWKYAGGGLFAEVRHVYGWEDGFKIRLPVGHAYYGRDATAAPAAPAAPTNTVTLTKMTEDEAWEKAGRYYDRYIRDELDSVRYVFMAIYRELGLIAELGTDIQRFEDFHGGLDNNQRDIAEAAIKWARENV